MVEKNFEYLITLLLFLQENKSKKSIIQFRADRGSQIKLELSWKSTRIELELKQNLTRDELEFYWN